MTIRKTSIGIVSGALIIAAGLASCGNNSPADVREDVAATNAEAHDEVTKAMKELDEAKAAATLELRELQAQLRKEMADIDAKLADTKLKAERRTELEKTKDELNVQLARLETQLGDVDRATQETWEETKAAVRKAADETSNWFTRQAEKIDRKTGADHDKDGH
ncbi:MAG: hypothetical protein IPJ76_07505 [Flavobacteriales bacterium]|nr:MAG: hypothetical protein IPJ76_07505 [Flavobacteriales bacterium]